MNLRPWYNSKKNTEIDKYFTKKHIDKIIETGFDWMISDQKVAVKAYTMEALFLFGKEIDWVHDELKLILVQEISSGSPAYKARAKKILKWIEKYEKRRKAEDRWRKADDRKPMTATKNNFQFFRLCECNEAVLLL